MPQIYTAVSRKLDRIRPPETSSRKSSVPEPA